MSISKIKLVVIRSKRSLLLLCGLKRIVYLFNKDKILWNNVYSVEVGMYIQMV